MAAPTKQGLGYFPHDIGLMKDRKLRRAKLKYGAIATNIYLALLEMIYGDKGFYLEYGSNNKDNVVWEILEYLQGQFQPTANTVSDVIEELVACELFSGDHYPEIITSKRIQQIYYTATVDRKAVPIGLDNWLLTKSEMLALSAKSLILSFFDNRPNNVVNRPINEVNCPNNKQSKVKESKVNKKREDKQEQGSLSLVDTDVIKQKLNELTKAYPNIEINCNLDTLIDNKIDILVLIDKLSQSKYLQDKPISFIIKNWEKVKANYYKTFAKPKESGNEFTSHNRSYTETELNSMIDDIDTIDI